MVFGLFGGGSRKAQASDLQAAPGLGDLKRLAAAVAPGTSASEWAMVSDADNKKKPKVVGPQPYKVEKHTVKTRLKVCGCAQRGAAVRTCVAALRRCQRSRCMEVGVVVFAAPLALVDAGSIHHELPPRCAKGLVLDRLYLAASSHRCALP